MAPKHRTLSRVPPLPRRSQDAHKGTVGRIVVIGGSAGEVLMAGAPAMVGLAALRTGAGLVQLFVPEGIQSTVAGLAPCATVRRLSTDVESILEAATSYRADVIALGPGLGSSLRPEVLVNITERFSGPVVLDADGLNLLATGDPPSANWGRRVVLTPHGGEMQRMLNGWVPDHRGDPNSDRTATAQTLARVTGCTVVFKGRGTVVADESFTYHNTTGNAGMATAGTGDVLTGVIAALIGQGMSPFEGAVLGVYLHGLAGDLAADEIGSWSLTATDVIDYLPRAFEAHNHK